VHLLKDGQRVVVPVHNAAVTAAVANIEWAVQRIIVGEFPARPSRTKCAGCDFAKLCPQRVQQFTPDGVPPPLHLPGDRLRMIAAFTDLDPC